MSRSNNLKENEHQSKHTDLSYLKNLAKGDNEFILEMIDAFFIQTPEAIDNLKTYLNNKNWVSLRGVAHKMKPSVTFMGIKELEGVIAAIEDHAANTTSLELLPDLIQLLEAVCVRSIKELEIEKKNFLI